MDGKDVRWNTIIIVGEEDIEARKKDKGTSMYYNKRLLLTGYLENHCARV